MKRSAEDQRNIRPLPSLPYLRRTTPIMSFKAALFLFVLGLIGMGVAMYGNLPTNLTLICFGAGLLAWIISALWAFYDRTLVMIQHLKRSWAIEKEFKAEKAIEAEKLVQRGTSQAKKRATAKRIKLWLNTIFGIRE